MNPDRLICANMQQLWRAKEKKERKAAGVGGQKKKKKEGRKREDFTWALYKEVGVLAL